MIVPSLIIKSSSYLQWRAGYCRTIIFFHSCRSRPRYIRGLMGKVLTTEFPPSHLCTVIPAFLFSSFFSFPKKKVFEDREWNHGASTLHRSETNGSAKWEVRKVKEYTSSTLRSSDLMRGDGQNIWNVITIYVMQDLLSYLENSTRTTFCSTLQWLIISFGLKTNFIPCTILDSFSMSPINTNSSETSIMIVDFSIDDRSRLARCFFNQTSWIFVFTTQWSVHVNILHSYVVNLDDVVMFLVYHLNLSRRSS